MMTLLTWFRIIFMFAGSLSAILCLFAASNLEASLEERYCYVVGGLLSVVVAIIGFNGVVEGVVR